MNKNTAYKTPIIFSIILHALLFSIFFINFFHFSAEAPALQQSTQIIHAVAVNGSEALAQMQQLKAEQQKQQQAEQAVKIKQMHEQAAAALAKQQAQQKIAQEKQQAEQEQVAKQQALIAKQQQAEKQAQAAALMQKQAAEVALAKEAELKAAAQKKAAAKEAAAKQNAAEKAALAAKQKALAKQQQLAAQKALQDMVAKEQAQMAAAAKASQAKAAQAQAMQGQLDKYKAEIIQAISEQWIVPGGLTSDMVTQLLVNVAPGGAVLSVTIAKSSGNAALDLSAKTAVEKASPLPVPTDPALFDNFRTIRLKVNPQGIVSG